MTKEEFHALVANLSMAYSTHVPREVISSGRADDWNILGPAIATRSHYLLQSVSALANRGVDAAILTRSLYEHVVTFAWLALDPATNVASLMVSECREREKSLNDLGSFQDLDEAWVAGVRKFRTEYVREGVPEAPAVPIRALKADEGWSDLFGQPLARKYSFHGTYPAVYRNFSSYTHVTTMGMAPFIEANPPEYSFGLPRRPFTEPVTVAPVLFGELLLVASASLGWPPRDKVFAAFGAVLGR